MKLPKLPFIGEKFLLKRRTLEDDQDKSKYLIEFSGDLPEDMVKLVYNSTLKKKTGLSFESGLKDGQTINVPLEFFNQKAGIYTWKETLLMNLNKHFIEVSQRLHWIFITKCFKVMSITRKGNKYSIYMEVTGEKADRT
jgi:hypothetical protein